MPDIELRQQKNNLKYIIAMGPRARSRIKICCSNWESGLRAQSYIVPVEEERLYPEYRFRIRCHCCGCDSETHPTFDLAVQAWTDRVEFLEVLKAL